MPPWAMVTTAGVGVAVGSGSGSAFPTSFDAPHALKGEPESESELEAV
jgi:hypothetical protein